MKALILLAGQGKRLHPLTENIPKGLLTVGGKSIIEHILDRIIRCNVHNQIINEAVLVTGHAAGAVRQLIGNNYKGLQITYVHSPVYNSTNNIYSVWLAKEHLDGNEFILINGDDIFNYKILHNLIISPHEDAAIIDKTTKDRGDAMRVSISNDKIIDIGKTIEDEQTHGDAIGIYKFGKLGSQRFFSEIKKLVDDNVINVFYLKALQRMIKDHDYKVVSSTMLWCEVDDLGDYRDAQVKIKMIEKEENDTPNNNSKNNNYNNNAMHSIRM